MGDDKTYNIVTGGPHNHRNGFYTERFISTNEAVKTIADINKVLGEEIENLKTFNKSNEIIIRDLKKMSYWEFYKFRKI